MRGLGLILASLVLTAFAGCQSAPTPEITQQAALPSTTDSGAGRRTIYVVSNGWHTGIVLARSDLPPGAIPETGDFPNAGYFEFSWGDAEYFPAPVKGLVMAMSALLTPTPAVLHLAGLPAHPRTVFPSAETIGIEVNPAGFRDLVAYLDGTFARGEAAAELPGLYPFSRFYPANGKFHLFNTCNTWTARGLAVAGIRVTVSGTLRAEDLMRQLR